MRYHHNIWPTLQNDCDSLKMFKLRFDSATLNTLFLTYYKNAIRILEAEIVTLDMKTDGMFLIQRPSCRSRFVLNSHIKSMKFESIDT